MNFMMEADLMDGVPFFLSQFLKAICFMRRNQPRVVTPPALPPGVLVLKELALQLSTLGGKRCSNCGFMNP